MERDGHNFSLWQEVKQIFSPAPVAPKDFIADVIIVGGGITGIVTALELQRAGKKCLLLEARNLAFGTSGGTTAHFNNFFDKTYDEVSSDFGKENAQELAKAANDALGLFRKNIESFNIDCDYAEMNGIVYATDEKESKELHRMYNASLEAGIPVSYVTEIPLKASFLKAISYPGQGRFHPVKYIYGLAKAFEQQGGQILENCFVSNVENNNLLEVETNLGRFKCGHLIYATHIPPGVNLLHLRCAPYRSYAMAIELEDEQYPEQAVYDMMDPYHYYRTQEINGQKLLIAGGEDHKTGHEKNTEAPFERLHEYLNGIFKIREIKNKWSSQYFESTDGLAYIGHLPGASKNILVATGFGGNGMTYSHIAAQILSSKITTSKDLYANLFDPARVKPVAGFSAFIKENSDVASSFIGDRLQIESIASFKEIPENSAQVVKHNGHNVGVYKSSNGELNCINPVCTHLKCIVKWNQTERSWDCPCHGARYSVAGEIMTGPATIPLQKLSD